jgi:hypothetical protein
MHKHSFTLTLNLDGKIAWIPVNADFACLKAPQLENPEIHKRFVAIASKTGICRRTTIRCINEIFTAVP